MTTRFRRSAKEPLPPKTLTYDQRFGREDRGVVFAWDRGREMRLENPELAACAGNGELIILPWQGGVEKKLKAKEKFGTLYYLAMWRGLRNEDLDIDLAETYELTCARFGQTVIFRWHDSMGRLAPVGRK